ncbi:Crp/Fnr family transcriptional regulator [Notoacmeibacter sp. MSK16QG-6]|uniref:Crp/Fnr family transcriptional regulator n=1 Tax=Notoacmeibacter sp. MSK16QG-6 TaxID=2957982 RepID=UPI0020A1448B|nr:Crp/Fnr family transcriptional regulator [Notoacmeibacter sp. MSK16QG-6]MCP1200509.1 Crp/Fnr family transcriptional regulator [Notoacmeibacter sp. MSK16QG-6]
MTLIDRPLCKGCPLRRLGLAFHGEIGAPNGYACSYRYERGRSVPPHDASAVFLMVRDGALKIEIPDRSGEPGLAGFLYPGEPLVGNVLDSPAVVTALGPTTLCALDLKQIGQMRERDGDMLRAITAGLCKQATEDQRRLVQARGGTVKQRVMRFLADVAERTESQTVSLNMSRTDIAHYLNISAESVSRAISQLANEGAIKRHGPRRLSVVASGVQGLCRTRLAGNKIESRSA